MGGATAVTAGGCAGGCGGKLGGERIFAGATMGDERHENQSEEGASGKLENLHVTLVEFGVDKVQKTTRISSRQFEVER